MLGKTSQLFTRNIDPGLPKSYLTHPDRSKVNFLFAGLVVPYQTHLIHPHEVDLFLLFTQDEIEKLKLDKSTYFFFDYMREGTNYHYFDFYRCLTESARRHHVPMHKIIFSSSNLLEKECYEDWLSKNPSHGRFKLLILNYWDDMVSQIKPLTIDHTVARLKNHFKYFVNFNRRKRDLRLYSIFELFHSDAWDKGLVSCDKIELDEQSALIWRLKKYFNYDLNEAQLVSLSKKTPMIIDRNDFHINWVSTVPINVFSQVVFSLVSETLIGEAITKLDENSLFYSEKFFKPMMVNHPIIAFGQYGANTYIDKLGYKTYSKYFNLGFDLIKNPIERIQCVVREVEKICREFDTMSIDDRIEWVLQDRDTLEHNKQVVISQWFNRKQFDQLFETIKQEMS